MIFKKILLNSKIKIFYIATINFILKTKNTIYNIK